MTVKFPEVDWPSLQKVYGWAALQFQAWTRGEICITGDKPQRVVLYTDQVLEFSIDGVSYFGGDVYSFRKAPPVIHLDPGSHRIDIRLVRDVRAMGGMEIPPGIEVRLDARSSAGDPLELAKDGLLISDVVEETLASPLVSVIVRNTDLKDIQILAIEALDVSSCQFLRIY